jgi:cation:H+ antiporter
LRSCIGELSIIQKIKILREKRMEEFITALYEPLPTLILFIIIAILLFTLSKGADILVDEAVSLSIHLGIPKMIIGATIVSLGTTLPEATVSVLAALNDNPDLALGNAIGSIIADTGLIIGLAAMIGRLPVDKSTINRQGRLQLSAGVLLAIVCLPFLSKASGGHVTQYIGFLFIGLLIAYIYISMKWAKNSGVDEGATLEEEKKPIYIQVFLFIIGILLVIASSRLLIPAVQITALRIGIPQSVIAATLVAFGTSLPELVTAITAVRKGHGELAIGNIIGADILNVLFVVGGAAAVTKAGLIVPTNFYKLQIPAMLIILILFRLFAKNAKDVISKKEGIILFAIYLVYLVLNFTWI